MYHHVVLFSLRDPADIPPTVDVLRGMEGRIPTLRGLNVGVDDRPGARSAHIALVTGFDDPTGYEAYTVHPFHQVVLAHMKTVVERSVKVDWAD